MLHPVLVSMLTVDLCEPQYEDIMCPEGSATVLTSLLSGSLFYSVVVVYCSRLMHVCKIHRDYIFLVICVKAIICKHDLLSNIPCVTFLRI